jgi:hypothetical protein
MSGKTTSTPKPWVFRAYGQNSSRRPQTGLSDPKRLRRDLIVISIEKGGVKLQHIAFIAVGKVLAITISRKSSKSHLGL